MNDNIYVLILVVLGVFVAYFASRAANNREATHSGGAANALNYLASGILAMLAPTILCNIIFIHPDFLGPIEIAGFNLTILTHVILIILVMIGLALLLLMIYAALEKPHLDRIAQKEDQGWTREDAETSGL